MSYVYFIGEHPDGPIKIGFGSSVEARLGKLQVGNPRRLILMAVLEDPDGTLELELHHKFWRDRIRGEWFRRTDEIMAYMEANALPWSEVPLNSPWKVYKRPEAA